MAISEIVTVITNVGFPIFMVLYMIKTTNTQINAVTDSLKELTGKISDMSKSQRELESINTMLYSVLQRFVREDAV